MGALLIIAPNMLFMYIMITGGSQLLNSSLDSHFLHLAGFTECGRIAGVLIETCRDGEWLFTSSHCILPSLGDSRYAFSIIIKFAVSHSTWKTGQFLMPLN